jgi:uncharacterized protein
MTIKEAILKSLEDINILTNYSDVTTHIIKNRYYDFKDAKTPSATVSALLGDFIRLGDTRVKRVKESGSYFYYLTKNETNISVETFDITTESNHTKSNKAERNKTYEERSLHKLLSSYLKNTGIYSKPSFMNNLTIKIVIRFGHTPIWLESSF